MKKLFASVLVAGALTTTSVMADPIADRKATMKNVGAAMGVAVAMVKGQMDYNPRVALVSFAAMNNAALGMEHMFPKGSESGGDTTAHAKIWEDAAGFKAAIDKFKSDTAAALAAKPADLDAFKGVFGKVAGNCKGCHEAFRVAKQ